MSTLLAVAGFTEQITFLCVADVKRSARFYGDTLGLTLVVDQGDCLIYRAGVSGFVGVCLRPDRVQTDGIIVTLVTDEVDAWHEMLTAAGVPCDSPPAHHPEYAIYQAFYRDPDGYLVEIQRFDDPHWSQPAVP